MPRGIQFTNAMPIDAAQNYWHNAYPRESLVLQQKQVEAIIPRDATQKEYKYIVNSFTLWATENTMLSSISPVTANINSMKELSQHQWQPF